MIYRIRQFTKALFPDLSAKEMNWVKQTLSPPAYRLFIRQDRGEQRHALDVAKLILNQSAKFSPAPISLSSRETQKLVTAALLHDCGKALVQVKLWHRVFIVLTQNLPVTWQSKIRNSQTFMALPLRISSRHARWGYLLAHKAGLNSDICRLIAEHHHPTTQLGLLLKQADDLS